VLLERVQHRFTRMIPGFRQLSYETRLDRLKLCTLEERPNRADLLEVFSMYKGMSLLPFHQFFRNSTVVTTRGHSAKIAKVGCHLTQLNSTENYGRRCLTPLSPHRNYILS